MSGSLTILRAGPLLSVQDEGRAGMLRYGVSASGPMDRAAWTHTGRLLARSGPAGLEFTMAGLDLAYDGPGPISVALGGGDFALKCNDTALPWPYAGLLQPGDRLSVTPGSWGNYGYLRLGAVFELPMALKSLATNTIVGLGGFKGRALRQGDVLPLETIFEAEAEPQVVTPAAAPEWLGKEGAEALIRVIWGIHADLFSAAVREAFVDGTFEISRRLDRMGIRLNDPAKVFAHADLLSLTSDSVVSGDIQILGDGTPIVLMRDHQPTGGYPRIATIISADLDRVAQLRPGTKVHFAPVTVAHAQALLAGKAK